MSKEQLHLQVAEVKPLAVGIQKQSGKPAVTCWARAVIKLASQRR